jgi:hypothetical protein
MLVAATAAWYTREQARQAKRSTDIQSERRAEEVADRRRVELAGKQARLQLHVQREENRDGSIDERPFQHSLVVTNDGAAEGKDVAIEIISAWNNPLGTQACFADGQRRIRVGRVLASHHEVLLLKNDPQVDFTDIGECDVSWRDDSSPDDQRARKPARPNWL